MCAKINYDNLYVACPVFDHENETEAYEQYVTFGTIEHTIIVRPKRVLIYSKVDEDGTVRYYNYKTGEEVVEYSYESSFETSSSPLGSLYCGYINRTMPMPISGLREHILARYNARKKEVGYFIPFTEFIQQKFGVSIDSISPILADKLLRLINVGAGKPFALSFDPEVAKEQLESIGYHNKNIKK